MKTLKIFSILSLYILLSSCQTDSLEKYFVEASENSDFIVTNIPTNIIQFDKDSLDPETIKQLESIEKINILSYKNDKDIEEKKIEYAKAKKAISSKKYKILSRIKDQNQDILIAYLGKNHYIDEVIFLGKDKKNNFLIGIIKGKKIHIKNLFKAFKHIKTIDKEQAKNIFGIFNQIDSQQN